MASGSGVILLKGLPQTEIQTIPLFSVSFSLSFSHLPLNIHMYSENIMARQLIHDLTEIHVFSLLV